MLDSFLDELVNQGACRGALVKTAKSLTPRQAKAQIRKLYLTLGATGATTGAIAHKGQKIKAEMDNKPLWMHPKGSSMDAAKRTGLAGIGLAGVMHAILRKKG